MQLQAYAHTGAATTSSGNALAHNVGQYSELTSASNTTGIEEVIRKMQGRAETLSGGFMSMLERRIETQGLSPLAWLIEKVRCIFGCRVELGASVPAKLDDTVVVKANLLSDEDFKREICRLKELGHIGRVHFILDWFDSDFEDEERHLQFRLEKILDMLKSTKVDTLLLNGIYLTSKQVDIVKRISQISNSVNIEIIFGGLSYKITGVDQYTVSNFDD